VSEITEQLKVAIADRYLIERELGQGGMATVYLAHDVKHERKVALKVLRPELAAVIGGERFPAKIKVTANLQHPHILPLHDSGEAGTFLYYVMPYVEGATLRDKLDREKQLGVKEAVAVTQQVAAALDYAHRNGGDPSGNQAGEQPAARRPADGGGLRACVGGECSGGRTHDRDRAVVGDAALHEPRAGDGREGHHRALDVYSLASVLYELLAGAPPHLGGSARQVIMKNVSEEASPVTQHRKSVPPNVAAALAKGLEKLPADRFDSAKACAEALGNPAFTTAAAATTAPPPFFRRAAQTAVFAAIAVLAVAVAAWGLLRPGAGDAPQREVEFTLEPPDLSMTVNWVEVSPDGRRFAFRKGPIPNKFIPIDLPPTRVRRA
jgi:serine/threonine protein kinase